MHLIIIIFMALSAEIVQTPHCLINQPRSHAAKSSPALKKAGTNLRLIGQLFVDIKQVITILY